jgi:hypothetical protein
MGVQAASFVALSACSRVEAFATCAHRHSAEVAAEELLGFVMAHKESFVLSCGRCKMPTHTQLRRADRQVGPTAGEGARKRLPSARTDLKTK